MTRRPHAPFFLTDREAVVLVSGVLVLLGATMVTAVVLTFVDPAAIVYLVVVSFAVNLAYVGWRVGRLVLTRGRADRSTPARRRARRADAQVRARQEDFDRRHPPTDDPYQHRGPGGTGH